MAGRTFRQPRPLSNLQRCSHPVLPIHQVHLGIDADTLEIRAIEVTGNGVGDAPMLPELLNQVPSNEPIASVSADGAYDTKVCHAAIAARHAEAIIPVRKNGRPWKEDGAGARARNEILRATRKTGRDPLEALEWLPPP